MIIIGIKIEYEKQTGKKGISCPVPLIIKRA